MPFLQYSSTANLFSPAEGISSRLWENLDKEFASEKRCVALCKNRPFDVLVLGAGPAGATAAIYSARKGLRTAIAAERLGGQVNETADIENFTSQLKMDGPALGAAFMRHVESYGVGGDFSGCCLRCAKR